MRYFAFLFSSSAIPGRSAGLIKQILFRRHQLSGFTERFSKVAGNLQRRFALQARVAAPPPALHSCGQVRAFYAAVAIQLLCENTGVTPETDIRLFTFDTNCIFAVAKYAEWKNEASLIMATNGGGTVTVPNQGDVTPGGERAIGEIQKHTGALERTRESRKTSRANAEDASEARSASVDAHGMRSLRSEPFVTARWYGIDNMIGEIEKYVVTIHVGRRLSEMSSRCRCGQ